MAARGVSGEPAALVLYSDLTLRSDLMPPAEQHWSRRRSPWPRGGDDVVIEPALELAKA